ncbi:hypothetical protein QQS21_011338 [Conoideocrella luteorostrata]|uniref:Fe2OG dioxygenase domain-containing protein n=1 Tax=Conoideocrella luteorostrata TaxID=1105319 RepID=A0AAJ0CDF9_9HYPO|nr:hypothetical protein QQS21_011338 [Conoideocrella luteorostrata]
MGYKPAGVQTGSVAGNKDGFEGFLIFEHALRSAPQAKPINGPRVFQDKRQLLETTNAHLGQIGRIILDSLSRSLQLTGDKNLASHPRGDEVGHIPHTDIGSSSMVFSDVPGLQVYHHREKNWMFIVPRPGRMICNIGDSAEFLSRNVLRSSLHRVIPHHTQRHKVKLTVVYLMRPPETDTVFVDRDGKEWRSVDWHNKKNRLFAKILDSQASNTALTGRNIEVDLWNEQDQAHL